MPVNIGLAQLSDRFLFITVILYALAMLAYASDFAYGRRAAQGGAPSGEAAAGEAAAAAVASTANARVAVSAGMNAPAAPAAPAWSLTGGETAGRAGEAAASRWRSGGAPASSWARAALVLTAAGLVTQVLGIVTRGASEHRIPWGNMYEFVTAITCAAVLAFLVVAMRYRIYQIGLFVMVPVVLGLGLCATILYTAAGPLVPALHSYWIAIHVTAAILSTGAFIVAAVLTVLYLIAARHASRSVAAVPAGQAASAGTEPPVTASGTGTAAAPAGGLGAILQRLPSAAALDRLSYRTAVFAFPIWTFAIIAGAIWADSAWGRYWGWDPKETWAFITWVVYAGYLHARATAGWRGRRAAYIQLAGFACLMFNMVGVNLWITGLHSYAGVG